MDLYIFKNGQNIGPLTPEQARHGLQNGLYQLDDRAITRDLNDWVSLEEVLERLQNRTTVDNSVRPPSVLPVEPVSVSQPKGASWLVGVAYFFFLVILSGMMGKTLEEKQDQIPAVDFLHSFVNVLLLVSFLALVTGLILPSVFEPLAAKLPALKARYFVGGM